MDESEKSYLKSLLFLGLGSGALTLFLVKLVYRLTTGVCRTRERPMTEKTVLITGSNRGIGKHTALEMAKRGAKVILACRSEVEGFKAVSDIIQATDNKKVRFVQLNLSSFKSVRKFCKEILASEDRLDVLINNAAIVGAKGGTATEVTEDGIELHFATNYFGPFLLTLLLLPLIKRSGPSRIINLSSILHFWGTIDPEDIYGRNTSTGPIGMYSNTKLASVLFTKSLSKKLEGTLVTVNAVHPGNTATNIADNLPKWMLFFGPLIRWMVVKSVEEGSQTTVYAAVSEDLNRVTGAYLADCKQSMTSYSSRSKEKAEWLWNLSIKITGLAESEKKQWNEDIICPLQIKGDIGSRRL